MVDSGSGGLTGEDRPTSNKLRRTGCDTWRTPSCFHCSAAERKKSRDVNVLLEVGISNRFLIQSASQYYHRTIADSNCSGRAAILSKSLGVSRPGPVWETKRLKPATQSGQVGPDRRTQTNCAGTIHRNFLSTWKQCVIPFTRAQKAVGDETRRNISDEKDGTNNQTTETSLAAVRSRRG